MKTLYLLRHAQTGPATFGHDKSRMLTETGEQKTQILGEIIEQKSYFPDLVLCSTATRTKQTLNRLNMASETLTKSDAMFLEQLYGASCTTLLDIIQNTEDDVESLMIVAHNPGIYEMVALLANEDSRDQIGFAYAPGTLSVFECPIENWAAIEPHENILIDILRPDPTI